MSGSGVVRVDATIEAFESLLLAKVYETLGEDKPALKAFEVGWFAPEPEDVAEYKKLGKRLFVVQGALGLNDGGQNWRAFNFQMEEGWSAEEDDSGAEQLAHQCKICVAQMKKEGTEAVTV